LPVSSGNWQKIRNNPVNPVENILYLKLNPFLVNFRHFSPPRRIRHFRHIFTKGVILATKKKVVKKAGNSPAVGIVMGSDSDLEVMKEAGAVLKQFDIPYEMTVASAHRSPHRAAEFASSAHKRIGVPIDSSCLQGLDSLLATVQMPPGIPVATMAIGKSGARNAGIFATQIMAVSDSGLAKKLNLFKQDMARKVEQKAKNIERQA
jgi:phosphoribosylcarboxyaminoimidazole (NCAIR) mutase